MAECPHSFGKPLPWSQDVLTLESGRCHVTGDPCTCAPGKPGVSYDAETGEVRDTMQRIDQASKSGAPPAPPKPPAVRPLPRPPARKQAALATPAATPEPPPVVKPMPRVVRPVNPPRAPR
jgi:hypothetical protein